MEDDGSENDARQLVPYSPTADISFIGQVLSTADGLKVVPYVSRILPWSFSSTWLSHQSPSDWLTVRNTASPGSRLHKAIELVVRPTVDLLTSYNSLLLTQGPSGYAIHEDLTEHWSPPTCLSDIKDTSGMPRKAVMAYCISQLADKITWAIDYEGKQPEVIDLTNSDDKKFLPVHDAYSQVEKMKKETTAPMDRLVNWHKTVTSDWRGIVQKFITDWRATQEFATKTFGRTSATTSAVSKEEHCLLRLYKASDSSIKTKKIAKSLTRLFAAATALGCPQLFNTRKDFGKEVNFGRLLK